MSDEKYWNLMSRYLSNDLTLEETEELLEWMNDDPSRADLLKELQDTWDKTRNYPENFKVDTRAGWQKVRTAIEVQKRGPKVRKFSTIHWLGLAASVIVVFFLGIITYRSLFKSELLEVEAFAGQQKEVVLPDGSKVWLNEMSSISYSESFNNDDTREVQLEGEAFFEVVKDSERKFVVRTGKTRTQVLGTSFNVKQDKEGSVQVSVVTGKVAFSPIANTKQELLLLPGDAGLISKEGYASKFKLGDENFLYWKNRELKFNNALLSYVVKSLEEVYEVKIEINDPDLLKQRITTSFNQVSFHQASEVLEAMLGLEITKSDSVYVVKKKQ
ncbi:FecR family protein [Pedobacter sp. SYSU D00535]|uniref:FecR family protein n=1 Tax=Pedobacter sp. SYSU D00535 TaxID=2810308 RepID=UPI001A96E094|nr:FecR domain-containing protein [Pedobacter sp. SYSU D00535]